jgi:serine/threonine protein kinase
VAGIAALTAQHTVGPGTAVYHPPEVLQGRYSAAIDVFSLGLLALEVALAESPRRQVGTCSPPLRRPPHLEDPHIS